MDLPLTLGLAALFAALAALCGWRGSLPPTFINGPRMMPWRPLMVACAVVTLVLAAHAVGLLGFSHPDQ